MRKLFYGVKRKVVLFSTGILTGAFLCACIATHFVVKRVINENVIEKYTYVNEKSVIRLNSYFTESDDLTEKYIADANVQKSLQKGGLNKREIANLKKELSYGAMSFLNYSFYIDNKSNVYGEVSAQFDIERFWEWVEQEGFYDTYSATKWIWSEDIESNSGTEKLYVGRLIRHLEYSYEPGILVMNLSEKVFGDALADSATTRGVDQYILTAGGDICYKRDGEAVDEEGLECAELVQKALLENTGGYLHHRGGILLYQQETDSGLIVMTHVSAETFSGSMTQILISIALIFLAVCAIAMAASFYFSNMLIKPIAQINEVMSNYDGAKARECLEIHTNTELDGIADTYNAMQDRMTGMLQEIKHNEQEMYRLQLDSLMYQINPHFLYNILDNIYMLARMNKDERTMVMIQSLSNFLRIGLSKGREVIPVEKELEHVKSYMDIQQVRNRELFSYEICCGEQEKRCITLKLILQPVVENVIQHGFAYMQSGGEIRINVTQEDGMLTFRIWNNGVPIDEETLVQLNQLRTDTLENMAHYFEEKKGGYGVSNVVRRLKLRYDGKFDFFYEVQSTGTTCTIRIPSMTEEPGEEELQ